MILYSGKLEGGNVHKFQDLTATCDSFLHEILHESVLRELPRPADE